MPGKGHVPDLTERIVRTLRSNTNRSAGGHASNAAPSLLRDRQAASRRGSSVLATQRLSKVDQFTITDDEAASFTLTHAPIADSWNVSMGFPFHRDRFTITGRTLTITDPTDTFRGVADNGDRTLEVQYDYYAGVPAAPVTPATFPQSKTAGEQTTGTTTVTFDATPTVGSSVLYVVENKFAGTQSGGVTGLGATWSQIEAIAGGTGSGSTHTTELWLGVGCDGSTATVTSTGDHTVFSGIVEVTTPLTATGAVTDTAVSATTVGPITSTGPGVAVIAMEGKTAGTITDTPSAGWTVVQAARHVQVAAVGSGQTVESVTPGFQHALVAVVEYA